MTIEADPVHILDRMGFRDIEVGTEKLVIEVDNRPELTNIRGALQGGLLATLIDIAAGRLAGELVSADQDVTTADMNVHFLAPVVDGPARAVATVVRAGKRLIVTQVDVIDAGRNRLAAKATLTFAVLDRR
jgi:uncharacterized protein (TIGR00369 family)